MNVCCYAQDSKFVYNFKMMESNSTNVRGSERQVVDEHPTHFLSEEDSIDYEHPEQITNKNSKILAQTIVADVTSNRKFLGRQIKVTLTIIIMVLFLQILPSPLIETMVENNPSELSKQPCNQEDQECASVGEGYESITIHKVNPLQRQLKYFVRLNKAKLDKLSYVFEGEIDINDEITWVEIYASRNGAIYGDVLYEKDGSEIYELLFDNEPLIFVGEVHILEEQSYVIQIYKVIRHVEVVKKNDGKERKLEESNATLPDPDDQIQGNSSSQNSDVPQNQSLIPQNQSTIPQNQTITPLDPSGETISPEDKNETETRQTIEISVPLTVELIRYSQFYTVCELCIRYVTFLFVIYVRIETKQSPFIFHIILLLVSNPLIFIELAFPNFATNCISIVFGSTYIAYLAVFLFYWHRKLKSVYASTLMIIFKVVAFLGIWVTSVMRQMHLVNRTTIEFFQYILICMVLMPLLHYFWRLYFFKLKTILHRNVLFISLTTYYLFFLFFSGFFVHYGWKKISFYLIVQSYGIELCYLTAPFATQFQQTKKKPNELIEERHPHQGDPMTDHMPMTPQKKQEDPEEQISPKKPSLVQFVEVDFNR